MSKKTVTLKSSFLVFLSPSLREKLTKPEASEELSEEETQELEKAKEFFHVEELNAVGEFTTTLENALWSLFEKLPTPESPLRLKAHERNMQEIASKLDATLKTEDLPQIESKSLKSVMSFVEDPEKFREITFPFEYSNGEVKRVIPLPAVNVLSDEEFVSTLDEVFSAAQ